jgi:hypothetical protein
LYLQQGGRNSPLGWAIGHLVSVSVSLDVITAFPDLWLMESPVAVLLDVAVAFPSLRLMESQAAVLLDVAVAFPSLRLMESQVAVLLDEAVASPHYQTAAAARDILEGVAS